MSRQSTSRRLESLDMKEIKSDESPSWYYLRIHVEAWACRSQNFCHILTHPVHRTMEGKEGKFMYLAATLVSLQPNKAGGDYSSLRLQEEASLSFRKVSQPACLCFAIISNKKHWMSSLVIDSIRERAGLF